MSNSNFHYCLCALIFLSFCNRAKAQIFDSMKMISFDSITYNDSITCKKYFLENDSNKSTIILECYYPNNNLSSLATYYNSKINGVHFTWYADGTLKSVQSFILGYMVGHYSMWHPNGKLAIVGEYYFCESDTVIRLYESVYVERLVDSLTFAEIEIMKFSLGLKNGIWRHYNIYGELVKEELYVKGELIEEKNKANSQ
jgi:antitoxin component YwqK of YwqJK toxin-antitoxin module